MGGGGSGVERGEGGLHCTLQSLARVVSQYVIVHSLQVDFVSVRNVLIKTSARTALGLTGLPLTDRSGVSTHLFRCSRAAAAGGQWPAISLYIIWTRSSLEHRRVRDRP